MSSNRRKLLTSILLTLLLAGCVVALRFVLKLYRLERAHQSYPSEKSAAVDRLRIRGLDGNKKDYQAPIEGSTAERAKLDTILKRMERASRSFRSFVADITTTKYTAILETFEPPENGKFFYKRADDGTALIRWEIVGPGERTLTIQNDEALLYQPKIRSAQKYRLGQHKDKAEYLALGIGQSPTDLQETFTVTYRGSENVRGTSCSVLELKPKDPKAAAMFSSITVWIADSTGVSTRMKLQGTFEDYLLVDFSNEQLNERIDDSRFRQNLPDNVDMVQIN